MAPQRAIPAATVIRAAHALHTPRPSSPITPEPCSTQPLLNVDVLVSNIVRIMEDATTQAAGAAASAASTAMVAAIESAFAKVTESAIKPATATPEIALVKAMETAFIEALKATVPITGQAIEAAATKALAQVLGPVGEMIAKFATRLSRPPGPSTFRTFFLPWIGDPSSEAVRVATAGNEPYEIVIRTVAPPGAFGIFSFDANELNTMELAVVAVGVTGPPTGGDVLIIPGGQFQIVRLQPKSALFAKGNIGPGAAIPPEGVIISITGGDFTAGLTAGPFPGARVAG